MQIDCKGITDEENKGKRNVARSQSPYNLQPLMNPWDTQSVTLLQELMAALMLMFY